MKDIKVTAFTGKQIEILYGTVDHWMLHYSIYKALLAYIAVSRDKAIIPDHERLVIMELFTFNLIIEIGYQITDVIPGYFTDMNTFREGVSKTLGIKKSTYSDIKPLVLKHQAYLDNIFHIFRGYHFDEKYSDESYHREWIEECFRRK